MARTVKKQGSKAKKISQQRSPQTPENTTRKSIHDMSTPSPPKSARRSKSRITLQFKKNPKLDAITRKKAKTVSMLVGSKNFKISKNIIREIQFYQTSTHLLIPKLPFSRLIHETVSQYLPSGRIQLAAVQALHEGAEAYLIQFFEDCYSCSLHARRCTLIPRDMGLVQHLRGNKL